MRSIIIPRSNLTRFDLREILEPTLQQAEFWRPHCFYAIRCEAFIKIGHGASAELRREQMQCCNPFDLTVVDDWRMRFIEALLCEARALKMLRKRNLQHRGEWFRLGAMHGLQDCVDDTVAMVADALEYIGEKTIGHGSVLSALLSARAHPGSQEAIDAKMTP